MTNSISMSASWRFWTTIEVQKRRRQGYPFPLALPYWATGWKLLLGCSPTAAGILGSGNCSVNLFFQGNSFILLPTPMLYHPYLVLSLSLIKLSSINLSYSNFLILFYINISLNIKNNIKISLITFTQISQCSASYILVLSLSLSV